MTDADFITWLKSDRAVRVVLVEAVARISGIETTNYLSNRPYATTGSDTPANTVYLPYIIGGLSTSEALDLHGGSASISYGDIEIDNRGGVRDAWFGSSYVWVNRQVQVFVGDVSWPRADFRKVFDGVVSDLDSRDAEVINLKMLDKLQKLNNPMTSATLGGAGPNNDRLIPLCFGEAFNVSPLLTNSATLEFQLHDGPIENIVEVRSNGAVPVTITKHLTTGKFNLAAAPNGASITASVQGHKPSGVYSNNISTLIQQIVTTYGPSYARFSSGDLDLTNLSAFAAAYTQPTGIYCADRITVLDVCQQLASSVGAQVCLSTLGLLRLVAIALPGTGTPTAIGAKDIEYHSLQIDSRPSVVASVKLGYCRNWTPQTNLAGSVNPASVPLFTEEWQTVTKTDGTTETNYKSPRTLRTKRTRGGSNTSSGASTVSPVPATSTTSVGSVYRLLEPPEQQDTLLLTTSDANTEAQRRLDLWKTPRTVYSMVGLSHLMLLEMGDAVTLTHSRFNLSGGVSGMVVRAERDWLTGRITLGVLV